MYNVKEAHETWDNVNGLLQTVYRGWQIICIMEFSKTLSFYDATLVIAL